LEKVTSANCFVLSAIAIIHPAFATLSFVLKVELNLRHHLGSSVCMDTYLFVL